jgi:hypothetical protein
VTAKAVKVDWARLFRIARAMIEEVNSEQLLIDKWTFGGGTAMMLQINHRESRDIDIFLADPQLLALLNPDKRDFTFEQCPSDYSGDGSRFMKLLFDGCGEIDFIVARPMTAVPAVSTMVEGQHVLLETIPEIIAKKIFYRGYNIKPRDIFDIAAIAEQHADAVIEVLRNYPDKVARTLEKIEALNCEFISEAIAGLAIKDQYMAVAKTAVQRAREILRAV